LSGGDAAASGLVTVRRAGPADADRVADLHAASWRSAYRGMLTDSYLDGPVEAERRAVWRGRLGPGLDEARIVYLAEDDRGDLVAFACLQLGTDERWGALIDNLHVAPRRKGQGLGGRVLAASLASSPASLASGIHLFVKARNEPAQRATRPGEAGRSRR
jgi:predicted N-acetyltransferase YhbS